MKKVVIILVVIVALAAVGKSGLFNSQKSIAEQTTDETIAQVIKGGNSIRSKLLRNYAKIYKDYRVYKAEDGKGVVFEYTLIKEVDPEKMGMSSEPVKSEMLATMRKDKRWTETKAVLKKGIYFHMQYIEPDGDIVMEFKVTESDI